MYGNFSKAKNTHIMRLESELSALRAGYAHTDIVGILPGKEMKFTISRKKRNSHK